MAIIKEILLTIAEGMDFFGIIILIYGFTKLLIKYIIIEFIRQPFKTPIFKIQPLRCELGIYTLLALDFLIASDIIHTTMDMSTEKLIEFSVMIVLRTGIGYFLGKEIEEIHSKNN